jgi:hypothetical protein
MTWIAAILGGSLAATSHATKMTTRAAVNTSPEPFSNLALSFLGDAAVPGVLWLAFAHPVVAMIVLAIATLSMVAIIALLMKFLRGLIARLRGRDPAVGPAV